MIIYLNCNYHGVSFDSIIADLKNLQIGKIHFCMNKYKIGLNLIYISILRKQLMFGIRFLLNFIALRFDPTEFSFFYLIFITYDQILRGYAILY